MNNDYSSVFKDKIILVTGAAGTVGKVLIRNLLKFNPASIRALDNSELGLFELEKEITSVTDKPKLM